MSWKTTDEKLYQLFDESRKTDKSPLYAEVPKDLDENLAYRAYVIEQSINDREAAHDYYIASKRDILFWINTFVWTYDPRLTGPGQSPATPFITYDFQDEAFLRMQEAVGVHDLFTEKARDQGASWMYLTLFDYFFWFGDMLDFLMISRNEDYVDKIDNKKALFWKLDFIHKYLPGCIFPKRPGIDVDRKKLHLGNLVNGTTIVGESTTGDAGRGARYTAVLVDEHSAFDKADGFTVASSTQYTSNSRFFNSTFKGTGDAFHTMSKKYPENRKIQMHWSSHPVQNRGLYRGGHGGLTVFDKKFVFPPNYEFVRDGKLRSIYYDIECERSATKSQIASELDINPEGSASQFFEVDVLDRLSFGEDSTVQIPYRQGDLDFSKDPIIPIEFLDIEGGSLLLWFNPDTEFGPRSDHNYAVGADICEGVNSIAGSNSCLEVIDVITGEQVAEFASPNIEPSDFASVAIAICKWFGNALLIWEHNGPGQTFGKHVQELGYTNIYFRRDETSVSRKITEKPGWWSTKETKLHVFGLMRRVFKSLELTVRSLEAIDECRNYRVASNGSLEHSGSVSTIDSSGASFNHGDRSLALALAWLGCKEVSPKIPEEPTYPPFCPAARYAAAEKREREQQEWPLWKEWN